MTNLEKYKKDLDDLIERGNVLHIAMQYASLPEQFEPILKKNNITGRKLEEWKKNLPDFDSKYQSWYSESHAIIKQILPDRLADFVKLYEKSKPRKEITHENYSIEDYLQGLRRTRGWEKEIIVGPAAAIPLFRQQVSILQSVKARFESSLFDIRQLVQADLFDSELDAAKELLQNGFRRAAGAISGVVLEKHLNQVLDSHNIVVSKNAALGELNELLKKNGVIDVPVWRFIQLLSDIRNLADHDKKQEPTEAQIQELINGVAKITKTVF